MELNEKQENTSRIIKKIDDMYYILSKQYEKLRRKTFFKKIINSQELLDLKNKLSNLDLLRRFINGESFSLRQLLSIASSEELMNDEDLKNIVYSIRNKLNDIRGHSMEIDNQTLLDSSIFVCELSLDL